MKPKIIKVLSLLIVMTPLLEPYRLGSVSMDTMTLLITIVLAFVVSGENNILENNLRPFLIYAFIVPNLVAISYGYMSHITSSIIVLIIYALASLKVFPNLNLGDLLFYYKRIVYISCFVFVFQELMFASVGFRYSCLIPFLDIRYESLSMASFIQKQMFESRSSAFFLEPSHLAQYLLPYLAISLGENTKGLSVKKYLEPMLLTTVLFYLRSGCGIVGAICIWITFVLQIDLSKFKKTIFILCSIITSYLLWRLLENTEIVQGLLLRSSELSSDADYERSGIIRVTRGFWVYEGLDLLQQLFGVGTGGCIDAIENSSYFNMFFQGDRYLNNIQTLLVGFGVIGTFLFFRYFYSMYKNNNLIGKLILSAFLGLCFVESLFLTSKMILYFCIAYLFSKKIKNETYEKVIHIH